LKPLSFSQQLFSCWLNSFQLPFVRFWHQKLMLVELQLQVPLAMDHYLRTPAEPSPPPIKEPPSPMENPDAPVREPDPDDPAQI
jgi:hypothetical protein